MSGAVKFKIIKTPVTSLDPPTWAFKCPLCPFNTWPDMEKKYVKDQARNHIAYTHNVHPKRFKLKVKTLERK